MIVIIIFRMQILDSVGIFPLQ